MKPIQYVLIGVCAAGAVTLAIVQPNVPRLAIAAIGWARHAFGRQSVSNVIRAHDVAIAEAVAHRDSTRAIADSIDRTVVRPAYAKDAAARQQLRTVLAQDATVPLDVDSLKAALTVTSAAAVQLDSASMRAMGALVALVAARTAEASASDTVAARATSALQEERKSWSRERWVYRAKIAAAVVGGIVIGAIAHAL